MNKQKKKNLDRYCFVTSLRIRISTKIVNITDPELKRCTSRVLLLVVDSPFTPLVAITSLKYRNSAHLFVHPSLLLVLYLRKRKVE
jgi:hypothetical protein